MELLDYGLPNNTKVSSLKPKPPASSRTMIMAAQITPRQEFFIHTNNGKLIEIFRRRCPGRSEGTGANASLRRSVSGTWQKSWTFAQRDLMSDIQPMLSQRSKLN
jgi:hypothetical protein